VPPCGEPNEPGSCTPPGVGGEKSLGVGVGACVAVARGEPDAACQNPMKASALSIAATMRNDQFERRTRDRAPFMAISLLQVDRSQSIVPSWATCDADGAKSGVGTLQILYDLGEPATNGAKFDVPAWRRAYSTQRSGVEARRESPEARKRRRL
jgi:hypothetical protein